MSSTQSDTQIMPSIRHKVLANVDELHAKYTFTDAEYKNIAEALAGKEEPLDVSTASVVKVYFDEQQVDWNRHIFNLRQNQIKILRVVDELEEREPGCALPVHWSQCDIERSALEELVDNTETNESGAVYMYTKSCECCYDERVYIKKFEVLE